jgi:MFS family permease
LSTARPSTPTLAALRSFPGPVWILFAGTFLNKFGTFVIPFLALYLTRQGYSTPQAGVAISCYGVGQLLAAVWGGHLADTIGRRKTIVISMFSVGAAMLLLSQARSFPAICALTLLAGLTGELYRPAGSAMLTDLVPHGLRVTAFAAYRMAFNAGWAFGPATAGFLASYSFFWLFVGDSATSVLYGLVAWSCLPRGTLPARAGTSWVDSFRAVRRDPALRRALLSSLAIGPVFLQMASTYGLHITDLGFSDKTYGLLLSLNGVLIVCCELPVTEITRRHPTRLVIALGYLLVGGGFALNGLARTIPELVTAMVVFTLGEMIALPVFAAHLADLAPADLRGRYMGAWALTGAVSLILGPSLGMSLYRFHPSALWWAGGSLGVLAAVAIGWRPGASRKQVTV